MTECNGLESRQQARGTQLRAFGAAAKLATLSKLDLRPWEH